MKDCNIIIDDKNVFDQQINRELKTYENVRKIVTGQGYDYTTGWFLGCSHF